VIFNVEKGNLFDLSADYVLAHCISQDLKMGKGIAVDMKAKFNLVEKFKKHKVITIGDAILIDRVFNLITKRKFWDKPTYSDFSTTLKNMKDLCVKNNITKLGLPKLGCGLDGLNWDKVKKMIQNEFQDTDIEIQVRIME
jgi:O-acetyl-ADP-ribose deacetylase (regulator of RNase III)